MDTSKDDGPAIVARRILDGFRIVADQLRAQSALGSQASRLCENIFIVGETINDFYELIERFAVILLSNENGNKAAPHCGNAIRFISLRNPSRLDLSDLGGIELLLI